VENNMENQIIPVGQRKIDASLVWSLVIGGKPKTTATTYNCGIKIFAEFAARFAGIVSADPVEALGSLIALDRGDANSVVTAYRNDLAVRKYSPASINNYVSAIRSFVKQAKIVGLIEYTLDVDNVRSKTYRDTSGGGYDGYKLMLAAIDTTTPKGRRDMAMLRLLHDRGLRRAEVANLDVSDFDPEREWGGSRKGGLAITQKRDTEKTWIGLPETVVKAIAAWLECRGMEPGALFKNLDLYSNRPESERRLSDHAIWVIVKKYGVKAGLKRPTSPHKLRHGGATRAAKLTNGNAVAVREFGRWKSLEVAKLYIDQDANLGAQVAEMVSRED
jgi:integrase/recombinase XerC